MTLEEGGAAMDAAYEQAVRLEDAGESSDPAYAGAVAVMVGLQGFVCALCGNELDAGEAELIRCDRHTDYGVLGGGKVEAIHKVDCQLRTDMDEEAASRAREVALSVPLHQYTGLEEF